MVANQNDSGNQHSNKDYVSSESKKKANTGYSFPSTHTSDANQKVIIPVPSYNLDSTGNYNPPQHSKEHLWADSVITSSHSNMGSNEYHPYSTKENLWDGNVITPYNSNMSSNEYHPYSTKDSEKISEQGEATLHASSSNKSNIDSLFFGEQRRDKVIMPVPNSTLESKKTYDWDQKIIIPVSTNRSESADIYVRAEPDGEVKWGTQKIIMPVQYSSVTTDHKRESETNTAAQTLKTGHRKESEINTASQVLKTEHRKESEINTADQALKMEHRKEHGMYTAAQALKMEHRKPEVNTTAQALKTDHIKESKINTAAQALKTGHSKESEVHTAPQALKTEHKKESVISTAAQTPKKEHKNESEINTAAQGLKRDHIKENKINTAPQALKTEHKKESVIGTPAQTLKKEHKKESEINTAAQALKKEHRKETEKNTAAQAKRETVGKYSKESKSTAHIIHGVLKDNGAPQEVSQSERKQMFGDPRRTVLTPSEIEQQTEKIRKIMKEKEHAEIPPKIEVNREAIIPGKESPTPVSASLQSEREAKKQKIVSDNKQQQPTDKEGMQQPLGLKILKQGAKSVKNVVSSLTNDKIKDRTDVKKEALNRSVEQPSNLKENVQKTSVSQFLYNKKYKDSDKLETNETRDKMSAETKTVKPSDFLEEKKKEGGKVGAKITKEPSFVRKSSIVEDNSVKYVVSERKIDNEIKKKENKQNEPKSKISDIKKIYTDEPPIEKEQLGRITEDNVSAIEKYLQQEISKVSPEKVRGNMTESKKGVNNSKLSPNTEKDVKTLPSKKSAQQKVEKLKKMRQNKDDKMQHNNSSNTADILTKNQVTKTAKDAVSKQIKEGSAREEQKKPPQQGTPPKGKGSSGTAKPDMHSSFDKYSTGKKEPDKHSSFDKYSTEKNNSDMHSSFEKYSMGKINPSTQSSFDKNSGRKNNPDMHSSFGRDSTGKNDPELRSSFGTYSTGKKDGHMHSSAEKYSTSKSGRTEEILPGKHNKYFEAENTETTRSQKPERANLTESHSHYSITDTKDKKLDNKYQNQDQKNESSNQSSKSGTRQGMSSQSITLLDSPPRYLLKDVKESEVTNTAGGQSHPNITQNNVWPVHQLSTVNKRYLGRSGHSSSWGDTGTFLPWVSYVAQKKNNQNHPTLEKPEGPNNLHVTGSGSGNPFWQFVGRQYDSFKDNFNSHTLRGRANVAKATLLAVGIYTMWHLLKPKPKQVTFKQCSECGSVTPLEKKY